MSKKAKTKNVANKAQKIVANIPLKEIFATIKNVIQKAFKYLVGLPLKTIFVLIFITPLKKLAEFTAAWWRALVIFFLAAIFLYYPIGGYLIHKIDTTPNPQFTTEKGSSRTVGAFEFLINREVNKHLWTPNLPFFYPSFLLDNMPNFQLGILSSVASFSQIFSSKVDPSAVHSIQGDLAKAAELLQYPGTIWMFSPENRLIPVPSSTSKYREALRFLRQFNSGLHRNIEVFHPNENELQVFLRRVNNDLAKTSRDLSEHVRENSGNWFDFRADNVFYYHKGRIYAYAVILNALGEDYQEIILSHNLYEQWTFLIKALEQGSSLSPWIVRNGSLNSTNTPNHLMYLNFYSLNAQNTLLRINAILEKREQ